MRPRPPIGPLTLPGFDPPPARVPALVVRLPREDGAPVAVDLSTYSRAELVAAMVRTARRAVAVARHRRAHVLVARTARFEELAHYRREMAKVTYFTVQASLLAARGWGWRKGTPDAGTLEAHAQRHPCRLATATDGAAGLWAVRRQCGVGYVELFLRDGVPMYRLVHLLQSTEGKLRALRRLGLEGWMRLDLEGRPADP